jgi:hypothetical protein
MMNLFQKQQEQTSQEHAQTPAPTLKYKTDNIEIVPEAQIEVHAAYHEQGERIDVETVADLLTDRKTRVRRGVAYWSWMVLSPLFALVLLAFPATLEPLSAALSLLGLCTIHMLHSYAARLEQTRAALYNAHLDRRWLGPLAEALEWPDRQVKGSAALLLIQMLPRLTAADSVPLTEEQHNCLFGRLTRRAALRDPELALAILNALPWIGTEAALPRVQRLATLRPATPRLMRVRDAARASLAQMERQAARERDRQAEELRTSEWIRHELADIQASLVAEAAATTVEATGQAFLVTEAPAITVEATGVEAAGTESERRQDRQNESHTEEQNQGQTELGQTEEHTAAEEQTDTMAALVDAQLQEYEAELQKLQSPGMRVGFLFASWGVIVPYCCVQTYLQFAGRDWAGGILFGVLTLLSTQLYRLTLTDRHRALAKRLSRLDDVRCVSRLAEALEWPDPVVRQGTLSALTRLLPRVQASDNVLRSPRQRANLHRMLTLPNARTHERFLIALLSALEQVGDETSVPPVEQLAKAQPTSAAQRRVCDAARECLPALQMRAANHQSSHTLLRASSATATGVEMLVRPVNGETITNPEQLLRAGQGTEIG